MTAFTIMILTKNEEHNIVRTLKPLGDLTDDLLVVDSGSADHTISLAQQAGARVIQTTWQGYANTKNWAHTQASHDWICSLDADEEIDEVLKKALKDLFSADLSMHVAYMIKRKLVYCGKILHHGSVSNEYRLRIYHKKIGHWNRQAVHEDVEFTEPVQIKKLSGLVLHHSYQSTKEHEDTIDKYAKLFAEQKMKENKTVPFFKAYLSPLFGFIKNYIFRTGFLDGYAGWQFALIEMKYTFRKYQYMRIHHK